MRCNLLFIFILEKKNKKTFEINLPSTYKGKGFQYLQCLLFLPNLIKLTWSVDRLAMFLNQGKPKACCKHVFDFYKLAEVFVRQFFSHKVTCLFCVCLFCKVDEGHKRALHVLSMLGCITTIVCACLTIAIYFYLRFEIHEVLNFFV